MLTNEIVSVIISTYILILEIEPPPPARPYIINGVMVLYYEH